jgi:hypothetical protein
VNLAFGKKLNHMSRQTPSLPKKTKNKKQKKKAYRDDDEGFLKNIFH